MNILEIFQDTYIDNILDKIEEIVEKRIKFVVLRFDKELDDTRRKKVIHTIKKYFDIFIILQVDVPDHEKRIEEYLSHGIHGIFFNEALGKYTEKQIDIITYAVEIFPDNLVFVGVDNNKPLAERLLYKKIIPIVPCWNKGLIDFIKNHEKFSSVSSNIIKYIPILEANQSKYTIVDKIKMKMLLEAINLRQKLMVKNVEDSFNSSSL